MLWVLDQLPVGVWVGECPDGRVAYTNAAFRSILGTGPVDESRIGDVPQTYRVRDREGRPFPVERLPFSQVLATGTPVVVDDMVIHRDDGVSIPIRAFGTPVVGDGCALTHVVVTFLDISREEAAERTAKQTERQLGYAVTHAPVVIWATDGEARVTLSQGAALASLGFRPGELVGRSAFEVFRDVPEVLDSTRRALAGEAHWSTVEINGVVLETFMSPLRDTGAQISGILGLSRDVTELRRLHDRALQDDRVIALGTLAASVAHEVNNPLSYLLDHLAEARRELREVVSMLGTLDAPMAGQLRDRIDHVDGQLRVVDEGAARIASIMRELRSFARDDEGTEAVLVREAVESVLALVRKEIEGRGTLSLSLGKTAAVAGSKPRLVQVVLNLVLNALAAVDVRRPDDGLVEIRTYEEGGRVIVEVADNGPGVPHSHRERIFEPFFTTKSIGEGTGLGLFVSRNILRGMGGSLTVHDRPGGGALFRASLLPFDGTRADAGAGGAKIQARAMRSRARILVVDDEPLVADMMAMKLRRAGFDVEIARDGKQALTRLEEAPAVDLVFCDLMMRGVTGMDVGTALTARDPEWTNRIVFMTGGAFTPEGRAFVARNESRCVDKPFDVVAEARARLLRG